MRTILITIACTVLATFVLLSAVAYAYISQAPRTYSCVKLEQI
jgi:hypothetical protein